MSVLRDPRSVIAVAALIAAGCGQPDAGPTPVSDLTAARGTTETTTTTTTTSGSGTGGGEPTTSDAAESGPGSTQAGETSSDATGSGGNRNGCEAGGWEGGDGGGEDQDDGAEESEFGMGDDTPLSVYQVQQHAAQDGEGVLLTDVLVTTPPSPGEALGGTEFFVQELAGGPFSGVRIQSDVPGVPSLIEPGTTVDIRGVVARHLGYYILRLESADDLVGTGVGTPPEPPVVAAADLNPRLPNARQFEGVVVRVDRGKVTDPDPCDGEFILDDAVRVDDRFVPGAIETPAVGAVIPTVEGVVVFALDGYELAPTGPLAQ